ncbi:hypothetical protein RIF29_30605 [Crotalaria pallida]|uniref:Equilibrative nucleoside transporter n=1 Tax=Crotalaria pallida TaxID=3830 RepID=A0AAN9EGC3_CROPI
MIILARYESRTNTRLRNLSGYAIFFTCSVVVLLLDLATSGRGGIGPYVGLCILCACFGFAHAFIQGGMAGDLSLMCPEFMQSFIAGICTSGVIASVLRILTKASFEKSRNGLRKGALLSFAISTVFHSLCIILYALYFPNLPIVKFYRAKAASEGSKTVSADLAAAGIRTEQQVGIDASQQERLSKKQLFIQNIDYFGSLFLIHVLTFSINPGFLYEDTGSHQLGSWYPLVLLTMFNVGDLISAYIPLIKCLELKSRKQIVIATLLRYLLIPAFYFTAKYGRQGWMIFLVLCMGLTHNYIIVSIFSHTPRGYKGPEQHAIGNILAVSVLSGIFAGSALDFLWLIGKPQDF